jgi:beta-N-acetylhexosaminidase
LAGNRITRPRWAVPSLALAVSLLTASCAGSAHHPAASGVPAVATTTPPAPATSPPASVGSTAPSSGSPLTAAELAGQRVIYSYRGHTPPASLLKLIAHGEAAGVVFFAGNYASPSQFTAAVKQLDRAAGRPTNRIHLPLLLMTDQEGGQVRRLPGAPTFSPKQIGQSGSPTATATKEGAAAASNLRAHGLDVNLAPVLDVYRQGGNFIDQFGRSFSGNPATVARLGTAFASAQQKGGVAATVKHFPGLGAAAQAANTDLRPVTLPLSAGAIRGVDEVPYRSAIKANVKLVMLSWATYPALDPHHPAGLSPTIVQGELRKRLGFTGVTITDALEAHALRAYGSFGNRATQAARAGMDLILCSAGSVSEGQNAMAALKSGYQHHTLNRTTFIQAASRVLNLRAWLQSADK